ncbi:MAG: hypothetical protein IMZ71_02740 [Chloroflexi bacterium]|nr:hypothetical protein [Chloroflexota bacterium]
MTRILLYRAANDALGKLIRYFTESEWGHVAIYAGGATYEQTWPGVKKTEGRNTADLSLIPPLLDEVAMIAWLETSVSAKLRYNWPRLVAMIVVYPLRWFFNKLGWVPFSAAIFGEICSSYGDEAIKVGGLDAWPYRGEHATVPGDFVLYPGFKHEIPAGDG